MIGLERGGSPCGSSATSETAPREALAREPEPLAVVTQHAQRGMPPIPEDKATREGIRVQYLAADAREAINARAKILRVERDHDPHLRRDLNHAVDAPANASREVGEIRQRKTGQTVVPPLASISITAPSASGGRGSSMKRARGRSAG